MPIHPPIKNHSLVESACPCTHWLAHCMRYKLAVGSGLVFAITWPRLYPPPPPVSHRLVAGVLQKRQSSSLRYNNNNKNNSIARIQGNRQTHNSNNNNYYKTIDPKSCSFSNLTTTTMTITYSLLKKQNAETSNALIQHWSGGGNSGSGLLSYIACSRASTQQTAFRTLANYEGNSTVARDQEDAEKLQIGIDFAKEKGVIDPNFVPEPYVRVDVLGKTPDMVADEIITTVQAKSSNTSNTGSVIVLCGLSGTGKARRKKTMFFLTHPTVCVFVCVLLYSCLSTIAFLFVHLYRERPCPNCVKRWKPKARAS